MQQDYDVANLKQHWAVVLFAWIDGCRPGTFTVSQGYGKGARLGNASVPTHGACLTVFQVSLARFVRLMRLRAIPIWSSCTWLLALLVGL